MIVVADTGPVNYLILSGQIDLPGAIAKLRATSIFLSEAILEDALKRDRDRR